MSAIVVPSGMLRISKGGETDRVVYPVHADGWRTLGWTVHPPVLELEEDDQPPDLGVDGAELPAGELGVDGTGLLLDEGVRDGGPGAEDGPVAPIAVPAFEAMTKAEIIATAAEHYGVMLDSSQTKAELVAAAQGLATEGVAASGAGDGEVEGAEALVPGDSDEPAVPELLL